MHKLIRFYYQNKIKVWGILLGIIFLFIVIRIFNSYAKEENQAKINNSLQKETTSSDVVSYKNESKSLTYSGTVSEAYQDEFGKLINKFYTYCINNEADQAYTLLTNDIKNNIYQSESLFQNLYCKTKFSSPKKFSFQYWKKLDDKYIYQIKIYDDAMATGKNSKTYIEDYITIVKENNLYKINTDSYIGSKEINISQEDFVDGGKVYAKVIKRKIYMDYEIITFNIRNNTDKSISIDSREKTSSTYIKDTKENRFFAFMYEIEDENLIFNPKENKNIEIKFSDVAIDTSDIKSITFSDIVLNYMEYENKKSNKKTYCMEINLQ